MLPIKRENRLFKTACIRIAVIFCANTLPVVYTAGLQVPLKVVQPAFRTTATATL